MIYDLIIVGMGPGGIAAGIYASRNGLNVLILEKSMPGGLVNFTSEVANYPGFKKITGPELAMAFLEQINELKIPYLSKEVLNIIDEGVIKTVVTKDEEYKCKYVLVATGRVPRKLGLENEEKFEGRGISRCALCDANFYKDKIVTVIGAGNSALEETIHLAATSSKVYLLCRRDGMRGDQLLQDEVLNNSKIEILYNTQINAINGTDKLESITLSNGKELKTDGLFVYIGYVPADNFVKDLVDTNQGGYILVDENYETSINGIYAVGDIISKKYYQIITAASEGAIAAINISNKINSNKKH